MKWNKVVLVGIFFISFVFVLSAGVRHELLTFEPYTPPEREILKGKRLMAADAARRLLDHASATDRTTLSEIEVVPMDSAENPGFLYYKLLPKEESTCKEGLPIGDDPRPARFLVSYHYRANSLFPHYTPESFTKPWVKGKLSTLPSERDCFLRSEINVLFLTSILSSGGMMTTSLHFVDRDSKRLEKYLTPLKNLFHFQNLIKFGPSIDTEEEESDKDEVISSLRRELEALQAGGHPS